MLIFIKKKYYCYYYCYCYYYYYYLILLASTYYFYFGTLQTFLASGLDFFRIIVELESKYSRHANLNSMNNEYHPFFFELSNRSNGEFESNLSYTEFSTSYQERYKDRRKKERKKEWLPANNLWFSPFGCRIFESWCLHIPVIDRTSFTGPPLSLSLLPVATACNIHEGLCIIGNK